MRYDGKYSIQGSVDCDVMADENNMGGISPPILLLSLPIPSLPPSLSVSVPSTHPASLSQWVPCSLPLYLLRSIPPFPPSSLPPLSTSLPLFNIHALTLPVPLVLPAPFFALPPFLSPSLLPFPSFPPSFHTYHSPCLPLFLHGVDVLRAGIGKSLGRCVTRQCVVGGCDMIQARCVLTQSMCVMTRVTHEEPLLQSAGVCDVLTQRQFPVDLWTRSLQ